MAHIAYRLQLHCKSQHSKLRRIQKLTRKNFKKLYKIFLLKIFEKSLKSLQKSHGTLKIPQCPHFLMICQALRKNSAVLCITLSQVQNGDKTNQNWCKEWRLGRCVRPARRSWKRRNKIVYIVYCPFSVVLGPVVQRWVSANPGLKVNLLF